MATLDVQEIVLAGAEPTYTSRGSSDRFVASDRTFLHVKNTGAASVTVTIDDPNSVTPESATAFNPDVTVVVAPSTTKYVGPFIPSRFADSDGFVTVTYSGEASVTVGVFKVPR